MVVDMLELSEHAIRNRRQWDQWAASYVDAGRQAWGRPAFAWGTWKVPECDIDALGPAARFDGLDVVELGCGTAYGSAWFARQGARVCGIDNSPEQLATARSLQREFDLEFPLELGSAESLPFPDESFDIAFSEYGASIWCDPYLWIPEAARVLRPGGELIFLCNSVLAMLCMPDLEDGSAGEQLLRPQFGMHRFEWSSDDSVEFHLPHGEMIDLLARCDLQVQRLIELQAPVDASSRHTYVGPEWARQWPSEEIWLVRKAPGCT